MQSSGSKKTIIGVVVVIILIVLGVYYANRTPSSEYTNTSSTDTSSQVSNNNDYVQLVNVKHQYKNGTHTYAGTIDVPTPCHTLTSSVGNDASSPLAYTLLFTSTASSQPCAQKVTAKPFKISFAGPKTITISGTLNGKKLRLNIFELRADQDIDSYDMYIKG